MTTIGWISFGAVCLIAIVAAMVFIVKKHPKTWLMLLTIVIACGICVGAFFGAEAIFKKTEEPAVETETVIEPAATDVIENG